VDTVPRVCHAVAAFSDGLAEAATQWSSRRGGHAVATTQWYSGGGGHAVAAAQGQFFLSHAVAATLW